MFQLLILLLIVLLAHQENTMLLQVDHTVKAVFLVTTLQNLEVHLVHSVQWEPTLQVI